MDEQTPPSIYTHIRMDDWMKAQFNCKWVTADIINELKMLCSQEQFKKVASTIIQAPTIWGHRGNTQHMFFGLIVFLVDTWSQKVFKVK